MATRAEIVEVARSWQGTPYKNQASLKHAGADCLGLLRGVFREIHDLDEDPEALPPYKPDWYERTDRDALVDAAKRHLIELPLDSEWKPGMVVLFRIKEGMSAKHCAILTDPDMMIHAYDRRSVVEVNMGTWWSSRVVGLFDFPDVED